MVRGVFEKILCLFVIIFFDKLLMVVVKYCLIYKNDIQNYYSDKAKFDFKLTYIVQKLSKFKITMLTCVYLLITIEYHSLLLIFNFGLL